MHLDIATEGAVTVRSPLSDEALAARRRARDPLPPTPPDLLSRASRADPLAFSDLVRLYWDGIRAFLRRQGAREDEAPDAAQGALVEVWENGQLAHFRPGEGSFRAWLRSVAKNHFRQLRREQHRQTRLQQGPAQFELERQRAACYAQCSERDVRQRYSRETIHRVWRRVAERYRQAGEVTLFDYLLDSLDTGVVDGDEQLSRELGHGPGYVTQRRHYLQVRDFAKDLRIEYRHLCVLRSRQGLPPLPPFRAWKRGLLDDLL